MFSHQQTALIKKAHRNYMKQLQLHHWRVEKCLDWQMCHNNLHEMMKLTHKLRRRIPVRG